MQNLVLIALVFAASGCNLFTTLDSQESPTEDIGVGDVGADFGDTGAQDASLDMKDMSSDVSQDVAQDQPDDPNTIEFNSLLEPGRSTRHLIALWEFNGDAANILDKSGRQPAMDLVSTGSVSRVPDRNGVTIAEDGVLDAAETTRLYDEVTQSNEFTLEVWMKPANVTLGGPARVVTFSRDSGARNFTLGQSAGSINVRLRTDDVGISVTRQNGLESLSAPIDGTKDTQYVAVYDHNTLEIWIDGEYVSSQSLPGGLGSWDPSYIFRMGRETIQSRQWRGEIYLVAMYGRALTSREIAHHFALGSRPGVTIPPGENVDGKDCVRWPFDLFTAEHFEQYSALGCTEVDGDVVVNDFDALQRLSGIKSVGGDLRIVGTASPDLTPLSALTSIGGDLQISKNPLIANVSALSSLETLGGSLEVTDNAELTDLSGLGSLTAIPAHLGITRNPKLTNLGVSKLLTVGRTMTIDDNDVLQSFDDLASLTRVEYEVVISRMPSFTELNMGSFTIGTHMYIRQMDGIADLSGLQNVRPHEFRVISNPNLASLAGIQPSAEMHLRIISNPALVNVTGLENLTEIDQLYFEFNGIQTFSFPNLTTVRTYFSILNETNLIGFDDAFPALTTVGARFEVNYVRNFTSFGTGFAQLQTVGGEFEFIYLDSVSQLRGAFPSLTAVKELDIRYNKILPECDALLFSEQFAVSGSSLINNNLDDGGAACK